jgi:presenilin-like A22 family membrane protease
VNCQKEYISVAAKPESAKRTSLEPVLWACLLYVLGLVLAFLYVSPEKTYVESQPFTVPEFSLLPIVGYFLGVVIVMGVVLWLIPVARLKLALRVLFGFFYAWGIFILLGLMLPAPLAIATGVACGLFWLFLPFVWLQNLLLLLTLVSIGSVFGALVAPWTVVWVLLAVSIYDIVAVSLGYMMWLAKKLSESDTLPAFILPKRIRDWALNLKGASVKKLFEEEAAERDFSLLGGGDIGFPLVLVVSVHFAFGFSGALVVAGASVIGLIFAYMLQIFLLKGKPLPALPPICFCAIAGFLIVYFLL